MFKKKPFFKILLGFGMTVGFVPLAIACGQSAAQPNGTEELNKELEKIPSQLQLKAGQVLSAQQFQRLFTSTNKANHLNIFNENVSGLDNNNAIIASNALNFIEGVTFEVTNVTVSGTTATVNATISFRDASVTRSLSVTEFLTADKSSNQTAINNEKSRLEGNTVSKEVIPNTALPSNLSTINSLAEVNKLLSNDITLPTGVTAQNVRATNKSGNLEITFTLSKGSGNDQAISQIVTLTLSGFRTQAQQDAIDVASAKSALSADLMNVMTNETAKLASAASNYNDLANFYARTDKSALSDSVLKSVTVTLASTAQTFDDAKGDRVLTLSLAKGASTDTLLVTVGGFKKQVQADVESIAAMVQTMVTAATEDMAKTALEADDYTDFDTFVMRTSQDAIADKKGTTLTLSSEAVDGDTRTLVITVAKTGAESQTVNVTVSGFKKQVQADVESIAAMVQTMVTAATEDIAKTALEAGDYTDFDTFVMRTSQNAIADPKGTTLTLSSEAVSGDTRTLVITVAKAGADSQTVNVTVSGFKKQVQADVESIAAMVQTMVTAATEDIAKTALEAGDYTDFDTFVMRTSQDAIADPKGTTLTLSSEAVDGDTRTLVITVAKTGAESQTVNVTVSGFKKQVQADVESIAAMVQTMVTAATEDIAKTALEAGDYTDFDTFVMRTSQNAIADPKGTTLTLSSEAVSGDTRTLVITVAKAGADSQTVNVTVSGFKKQVQADVESIATMVQTMVTAATEDMAKTALEAGDYTDFDTFVMRTSQDAIADPKGTTLTLSSEAVSGDTRTLVITVTKAGADSQTVNVTVSGFKKQVQADVESIAAMVQTMVTAATEDMAKTALEAGDYTDFDTFVMRTSQNAIADPKGTTLTLSSEAVDGDTRTLVITVTKAGADSQTVNVTVSGFKKQVQADVESIAAMVQTMVTAATEDIAKTALEAGDYTDFDTFVMRTSQDAIVDPKGTTLTLSSEAVSGDTRTLVITVAKTGADSQTVNVTVNGFKKQVQADVESIAAMVQTMVTAATEDIAKTALEAGDYTDFDTFVMRTSQNAIADPKGTTLTLSSEAVSGDTRTLVITVAKTGADSQTVNVTVSGFKKQVQADVESIAAMVQTMVTAATEDMAKTALEAGDYTDFDTFVMRTSQNAIADPKGTTLTLSSEAVSGDTRTLVITVTKAGADSQTVNVTVSGFKKQVQADVESIAAMVQTMVTAATEDMAKTALEAGDYTDFDTFVMRTSQNAIADPKGTTLTLSSEAVSGDTRTLVITVTKAGADSQTVNVTVSGFKKQVQADVESIAAMVQTMVTTATEDMAKTALEAGDYTDFDTFVMRTSQDAIVDPKGTTLTLSSEAVSGDTRTLVITVAKTGAESQTVNVTVSGFKKQVQADVESIAAMVQTMVTAATEDMAKTALEAGDYTDFDTFVMRTSQNAIADPKGTTLTLSSEAVSGDTRTLVITVAKTGAESQTVNVTVSGFKKQVQADVESIAAMVQTMVTAATEDMAKTALEAGDYTDFDTFVMRTSQNAIADPKGTTLTLSSEAVDGDTRTLVITVTKTGAESQTVNVTVSGFKKQVQADVESIAAMVQTMVTAATEDMAKTALEAGDYTDFDTFVMRTSQDAIVDPKGTTLTLSSEAVSGDTRTLVITVAKTGAESQTVNVTVSGFKKQVQADVESIAAMVQTMVTAATEDMAKTALEAGDYTDFDTFVMRTSQNAIADPKGTTLTLSSEAVSGDTRTLVITVAKTGAESQTVNVTVSGFKKQVQADVESIAAMVQTMVTAATEDMAKTALEAGDYTDFDTFVMRTSQNAIVDPKGTTLTLSSEAVDGDTRTLVITVAKTGADSQTVNVTVSGFKKQVQADVESIAAMVQTMVTAATEDMAKTALEAGDYTDFDTFVMRTSQNAIVDPKGTTLTLSSEAVDGDTRTLVITVTKTGAESQTVNVTVSGFKKQVQADVESIATMVQTMVTAATEDIAKTALEAGDYTDFDTFVMRTSQDAIVDPKGTTLTLSSEAVSGDTRTLVITVTKTGAESQTVNVTVSGFKKQVQADVESIAAMVQTVATAATEDMAKTALEAGDYTDFDTFVMRTSQDAIADKKGTTLTLSSEAVDGDTRTLVITVTKTGAESQTVNVTVSGFKKQVQADVESIAAMVQTMVTAATEDIAKTALEAGDYTDFDTFVMRTSQDAIADKKGTTLTLSSEAVGGDTRTLVITVAKAGADSQTVNVTVSGFKKQVQADVESIAAMVQTMVTAATEDIAKTALEAGDYTDFDTFVMRTSQDAIADPKGTTLTLSSEAVSGDTRTLVITVAKTGADSQTVNVTVSGFKKQVQADVESIAAMVQTVVTAATEDIAKTALEAGDYTDFDTFVMRTSQDAIADKKGTTLTLSSEAVSGDTRTLVITVAKAGADSQTVNVTVSGFKKQVQADVESIAAMVQTVVTAATEDMAKTALEAGDYTDFDTFVMRTSQNAIADKKGTTLTLSSEAVSGDTRTLVITVTKAGADSQTVNVTVSGFKKQVQADVESIAAMVQTVVTAATEDMAKTALEAGDYTDFDTFVMRTSQNAIADPKGTTLTLSSEAVSGDTRTLVITVTKTGADSQTVNVTVSGFKKQVQADVESIATMVQTVVTAATEDIAKTALETGDYTDFDTFVMRTSQNAIADPKGTTLTLSSEAVSGDTRTLVITVTKTGADSQTVNVTVSGFKKQVQADVESIATMVQTVVTAATEDIAKTALEAGDYTDFDTFVMRTSQDAIADPKGTTLTLSSEAVSGDTRTLVITVTKTGAESQTVNVTVSGFKKQVQADVESIAAMVQTVVTAATEDMAKTALEAGDYTDFDTFVMRTSQDAIADPKGTTLTLSSEAVSGDTRTLVITVAKAGADSQTVNVTVSGFKKQVQADVESIATMVQTVVTAATEDIAKTALEAGDYTDFNTFVMRTSQDAIADPKGTTLTLSSEAVSGDTRTLVITVTKAGADSQTVNVTVSGFKKQVQADVESIAAMVQTVATAATEDMAKTALEAGDYADFDTFVMRTSQNAIADPKGTTLTLSSEAVDGDTRTLVITVTKAGADSQTVNVTVSGFKKQVQADVESIAAMVQTVATAATEDMAKTALEAGDYTDFDTFVMRTSQDAIADPKGTTLTLSSEAVDGDTRTLVITVTKTGAESQTVNVTVSGFKKQVQADVESIAAMVQTVVTAATEDIAKTALEAGDYTDFDTFVMRTSQDAIADPKGTTLTLSSEAVSGDTRTLVITVAKAGAESQTVNVTVSGFKKQVQADVESIAAMVQTVVTAATEDIAKTALEAGDYTDFDTFVMRTSQNAIADPKGTTLTLSSEAVSGDTRTLVITVTKAGADSQTVNVTVSGFKKQVQADVESIAAMVQTMVTAATEDMAKTALEAGDYTDFDTFVMRTSQDAIADKKGTTLTLSSEAVDGDTRTLVITVTKTGAESQTVNVTVSGFKKQVQADVESIATMVQTVVTAATEDMAKTALEAGDYTDFDTFVLRTSQDAIADPKGTTLTLSSEAVDGDTRTLVITVAKTGAESQTVNVTVSGFKKQVQADVESIAAMVQTVVTAATEDIAKTALEAGDYTDFDTFVMRTSQNAIADPKGTTLTLSSEAVSGDTRTLVITVTKAGADSQTVNVTVSGFKKQVQADVESIATMVQTVVTAATEDMAKTALEAGDYTDFDTFVMRTSQNAIADPKGTTLTLSSEAVSGDTRTLVITVAKAGADSQTVNVTVSGFKKQVQADVESIATMVQTVVTAATEDIAKTALEAGDYTDFDTFVMRTSQDAIADPKGTTLTLSSEAVDGDTRTLVITVAKTGAESQTVNVTVSGFKKQVQADVESIAAMVQTVVTAATEDIAKTALEAGDYTDFDTFVMRTSQNAIADPKGTTLTLSSEAVSGDTRTLVITVAKTGAESQTVNVTVSGFKKQVQADVESIAAMVQTMATAATEDMAKTALEAGDYTDFDTFVMRTSQDAIVDPKGTTLTLSSEAVSGDTRTLVITVAKTGADSQTVNVTVSGFKKQVQADVESITTMVQTMVTAATEDIAKTALEAGDYTDFNTFVMRTSQDAIADKKGTTLTLSSEAVDGDTRTLVITVAKTGAESQTVNVTVSGFKKQVQADVESIAAMVQTMVTAATEDIAKTALEAGDYTDFDTFVMRTSQNAIADPKGTTLTLSSEAVSGDTRTLVITVTKTGAESQTVNVTVSGFKKQVQADVESIAAMVQTMVTTATEDIAKTALEAGDYTDFDTFVMRTSQDAIVDPKGTTLTLSSEAVSGDTRTLVITVTKTGAESQTVNVTVSGFKKQVQADVESIAAMVQTMVTAATEDIAKTALEAGDYTDFDTFVMRTSQDAIVDPKGTTLTLSSEAVSGDTRTLVITVAKTGAESQTVNVTVSGFKKQVQADVESIAAMVQTMVTAATEDMAKTALEAGDYTDFDTFVMRTSQNAIADPKGTTLTLSSEAVSGDTRTLVITVAKTGAESQTVNVTVSGFKKQVQADVESIAAMVQTMVTAATEDMAKTALEAGDYTDFDTFVMRTSQDAIADPKGTTLTLSSEAVSGDTRTLVITVTKTGAESQTVNVTVSGFKKQVQADVESIAAMVQTMVTAATEDMAKTALEAGDYTDFDTFVMRTSQNAIADPKGTTLTLSSEAVSGDTRTLVITVAKTGAESQTVNVTVSGFKKQVQADVESIAAMVQTMVTAATEDMAKTALEAGDYTDFDTFVMRTSQNAIADPKGTTLTLSSEAVSGDTRTLVITVTKTGAESQTVNVTVSGFKKQVQADVESIAAMVQTVVTAATEDIAKTALEAGDYTDFNTFVMRTSQDAIADPKGTTLTLSSEAVSGDTRTLVITVAKTGAESQTVNVTVSGFKKQVQADVESIATMVQTVVTAATEDIAKTALEAGDYTDFDTFVMRTSQDAIVDPKGTTLTLSSEAVSGDTRTLVITVTKTGAESQTVNVTVSGFKKQVQADVESIAAMVQTMVTAATEDIAKTALEAGDYTDFDTFVMRTSQDAIVDPKGTTLTLSSEAVDGDTRTLVITVAKTGAESQTVNVTVSGFKKQVQADVESIAAMVQTMVTAATEDIAKTALEAGDYTDFDTFVMRTSQDAIVDPKGTTLTLSSEAVSGDTRTLVITVAKTGAESQTVNVTVSGFKKQVQADVESIAAMVQTMVTAATEDMAKTALETGDYTDFDTFVMRTSQNAIADPKGTTLTLSSEAVDGDTRTLVITVTKTGAESQTVNVTVSGFKKQVQADVESIAAMVQTVATAATEDIAKTALEAGDYTDFDTFVMRTSQNAIADPKGTTLTLSSEAVSGDTRTLVITVTKTGAESQTVNVTVSGFKKQVQADVESIAAMVQTMVTAATEDIAKTALEAGDYTDFDTFVMRTSQDAIADPKGTTLTLSSEAVDGDTRTLVITVTKTGAESQTVNVTVSGFKKQVQADVESIAAMVQTMVTAATEDMAKTALEAGDYTDFDTFVMRTSQDAIADPKGTTLTLSSEAVDGDTRTLVITVAKTGAESQTVNVTVSGFKKQVQADVESIAAMVQTMVTAATEDMAKTALEAGDYTDFDTFVMRTSQNAIADPKGTTLTLSSEAVSGDTRTLVITVTKAGADSQTVNVTVSGFKKQVQADVESIAAMVQTMVTAATEDIAKTALEAGDYTDFDTFVMRTSQDAIVDPKGTTLTLSSEAVDGDTRTLVITVAKTGAESQTVNVTVSGFKKQVQADVESIAAMVQTMVTAATEDIAKTALEAGDYTDFDTFVMRTSQDAIADKKGTTLTLSSEAVSGDTRTLVITVAKTGAESQTVNVTVSGFKKQVQADVESIAAMVQTMVTAATEDIAKTALETGDYTDFDTFVMRTSQNAIADPKGTTLTLSSEAVSGDTRTLVITVTKTGAESQTVNVTVSGFKKQVQADVESIAAMVQTMVTAATEDMAKTALEAGDYTDFDTFVMRTSQNAIADPKGTTLTLSSEAVSGDTRTLVITVTKTGAESQTVNVTVSGFKKQVQADVESIAAMVQTMVTAATEDMAKTALEAGDYTDFDTFVMRTSQDAIADKKGTTLTLSSEAVDGDTRTLVITVTKTGAESQTVNVTVSGFKKQVQADVESIAAMVQTMVTAATEDIAKTALEAGDYTDFDTFVMRTSQDAIADPKGTTLTLSSEAVGGDTRTLVITVAKTGAESQTVNVTVSGFKKQVQASIEE